MKFIVTMSMRPFPSLAASSPLLAATQFAWLSRPSLAVLENPASVNSFLVTTTGIPQGDPLSSLAFAVALARPIRDLQVEHPTVGVAAYADDVLLDSTTADVHRVVNSWHNLIGSAGLRLNPNKIAVWGPNLESMPPRLAEACPSATFSRDGVVICGIPVDTSDDLPEDAAQPLGTEQFTAAFLAQMRNKLLIRLGALAALIDALGPSSPAAHLAVHILRVNLQTAFVHIFRACHWTAVHAWAGQLQNDVQQWLADILHCPWGGPATQLTLAMPLRFAGLGILNFQFEAALHFVQGALALNDNAALSLGNSETWSDEIGSAIGFLERVSGIDVETLAAPKPPRRQGRVIRDHFYEALARQLWDMSPGLRASGTDQTSMSLHTRYLLAWYVASPDTFLPFSAFRLAWASHLRLPVFAPEQRCAYRPLSTGRACQQPLGTHSVHVHNCAFGPRQRRHNIVRDAWLALLKAAHWHADTEQLVRTGDNAFHRADLTAAAPDGTLWAFDVSVTATPGPEDTVHAHLERSANAKASRYRPGGERRLPEGHTLVPLIHSADYGVAWR